MELEKNGSLHHVAIAVRDIGRAEELYSGMMGLRVVHREVVADQGVRTSMLLPPGGGGTAIELLEPLDENSPVSGFLEKRGEGIHHLCFLTDDVEASLRRLEKKGARLIDEHPRAGAYGAEVAFIHPRSMNGVLVELARPRGKKPSR